jgi:hypothetical protein
VAFHQQRSIAVSSSALTPSHGSTDSGPFYLGTGQAKTAGPQVEHDPRVPLRAAVKASIPLLVGSCGTGGTDNGANWVADMARRVAAVDDLAFTLA